MIDITLLKTMSNLEYFKSGQIVIEDGETMCDEMYILLRGSADVYKNYGEQGELKISTIYPGSFFGEMSLFLDKERTATVVAAEDSIALTINRENAFDFFKKQPEATYSLIKTLCSRLDNANVAYKKLYSEIHPETESTGEACDPSLSWLLPESHKAYRRTVNMSRISSLNDKSYTCPLCETAFTAPIGTASRPEPTYNIQRPGKGLCDFYYEAVMCPECWYSAFAGVFGSPDKESGPLFKEQTRAYKPEIKRILDDETGITGIFIKYCLALQCAPRLFENYEETTARLWIRLSWLYCDCKDEKLEAYAARQAQKAYIAAVVKRQVAKDQLPFAYFAIGELNLKADDLKTAKTYFERAESSTNPEIKQRAKERLEDVQQRMKNSAGIPRDKVSNPE